MQLNSSYRSTLGRLALYAIILLLPLRLIGAPDPARWVESKGTRVSFTVQLSTDFQARLAAIVAAGSEVRPGQSAPETYVLGDARFTGQIKDTSTGRILARFNEAPGAWRDGTLEFTAGPSGEYLVEVTGQPDQWRSVIYERAASSLPTKEQLRQSKIAACKAMGANKPQWRYLNNEPVRFVLDNPKACIAECIRRANQDDAPPVERPLSNTEACVLRIVR